jgi:hypothetical protein
LTQSLATLYVRLPLSNEPVRRYEPFACHRPKGETLEGQKNGVQAMASVGVSRNPRDLGEQ